MSAPAQPAEYTERDLTFQGPEGFPLAGVLCEPSQPSTSTSSSSSRPFQRSQCAILCHGFASHKQGFHFPAIAHHLAEQLGLSSLRFDYTGNMDSPGPFRFGSLLKEVEQMAAAKAFLEQQHGKQVVLLLGHSRGAINATLYSGQASIPTPSYTQPQQQQQQQQQQQPLPPKVQANPQPPFVHTIPLVVLVAGRYDLTLNMSQRYGTDVVEQLQQDGPWQQVTRRDGDGHEIHWSLSAQDMEERFAYDIHGACAAISSMDAAQRPKVLVVHGATDPICEASDAANLAHHIAGSQLVEVEGADHWFKGRQQQLLQVIAEFAQRAGREKGL